MTVRRTLLGLLVAIAALTGCGDDEADEGESSGSSSVERGCSADPPASSEWTGTPDDVDAFNEYLADAAEPVSASPCDAASVLLHLDQPLGEGTTSDVAVDPEDSADATVTVTLDGLADDSVEAQRWTLEFAAGDGEAIELVSAEAAYRCREGRGHQDFSDELCV